MKQTHLLLSQEFLDKITLIYGNRPSRNTNKTTFLQPNDKWRTLQKIAVICHIQRSGESWPMRREDSLQKVTHALYYASSRYVIPLPIPRYDLSATTFPYNPKVNCVVIKDVAHLLTLHCPIVIVVPNNSFDLICIY